MPDTCPHRPDLHRGGADAPGRRTSSSGRLVRPAKPSPEKGEVYECGEQPIGTAWVQFDLRFYVVALLFVIFDVELAFFFPWAVVFGSANAGRGRIATCATSVARRRRNLQPQGEPGASATGAPEPGRGAEARVARVRRHPGLLRRAAGRVRLPVAARRPGVGPQYSRHSRSEPGSVSDRARRIGDGRA